MASNSTSSSTGTKDKEFVVRIPKSKMESKCSIMQFGSGNKVDFIQSLAKDKAYIGRENNLGEFKVAHNIDTLPKFGADSEFGRDVKDEARRKKFGYRRKKYNINDQPWIMQLGSQRDSKRYKGVKEGNVSENTSYYVFTKSKDGSFEAMPVEDWYHFTPIINYKFLSSEEAEEEFSKREKTLDYFNVMYRRRVKNETEETSSTTTTSKSYMLTDMQDCPPLSDDEDCEIEDDDIDEKNGDENEGKSKKSVKKAAREKKMRSKEAKVVEDEAVEDSDEGDVDDREMADYITSSSGSDDNEVDEADTGKYSERGVADVQGLKDILESDHEEDKEENDRKSKDKDQSDSESDESDVEDMTSSALFLPGVDRAKNELGAAGNGSAKRKMPENALESQDKRIKLNDTAVKLNINSSPMSVAAQYDYSMSQSSSAPSLFNLQQAKTSASPDGLNEETISEATIRRYLMKKPMTVKELLMKFKSRKLNMSNDEMVGKMSSILTSLPIIKKQVNGVMYLSLSS